MFHLHEEAPESGTCCPSTNRAVTKTIGLMVADVDSVMARALAEGAKQTSPAQDYDYGYRQREVLDQSGHHWLIEKTI